MQTDRSLYEAALIGYQSQLANLNARIDEIKAYLAVRAPKAKKSGSSGSVKQGAKRNLSPAARKRIAAAQKARWAAYREKKAAA